MRIAINWREKGRDVAIWAAIAAFLAFINPYGATTGLSVFLAFGYWFSLIVVGTMGGELSEKLLDKFWPSAPWPLRIALLAFAATVAVTTCLIVLFNLTNEGNLALRYYPRIFGLVFVISLAITGVHALRTSAKEAAGAAQTDTDPVAGFMERLPIKYREAELYAVSSEDHYLRIHTDKGEEMILMRLADAMRELSGADGLQTHRSWWVAVSGVADAERDNGKLSLILKSGAKAPVSRTFAKAAKEKGLG